MMIKRVISMILFAGLLAAGSVQAADDSRNGGGRAKQDARAEVTVYKSPTCGCCTSWVKHMEANGFKVKSQNVMDIEAVKRRYGVTPNLASCHTAIVDGYVVEGHVPASDVQRLLRERPKVKGIAAPGMPQGSPGMEGPYKQPYETVTFDESGRTKVFARH